MDSSITTFNYCGLDSYDDLGLIVNDIRIPMTGSLTETVQEIPGMIGNLFLGMNVSSKPIEIDVTLIADSERDRMLAVQDLADIFQQTNDNEYPMIFSPLSEYTFYGHFTSLPAPQRLAQNETSGVITLEFTCSDPKAYLDPIDIQMTTNPFPLTPKGSSDAYPIFTCIPNKDVTKIAVTDDSGNYAYIGSDVDPDTQDASVDNEPLVFHDECNNLALWTNITNSNLTFTLENGVIGGAMTADNNVLKVGIGSDGRVNFGSPVSGKWHGPLVQQWLPTSYSDFRIRVKLYNYQYYARAMGKVEVYLLDSNGIRIGKIGLKDAGNSEEVYIEAQLGTDSSMRYIYKGTGTVKKGKKETITLKTKNGTKKVKVKKKTVTEQLWKTITVTEDMTTDAYTNFCGYIEIQKIGNKYRVEIIKLDKNGNPVWSKPVVINWTDTANTYTNNHLAGVAFYTAMYDIAEDTTNPVKIYNRNGMALTDVRVWNIINGGNDNTNPIPIVRSGDEVKINCEDRTVYKNGKYFMDYFYIGSNFPEMQCGIPQSYAFEPDISDATWYLTYRGTRN